MEDLFVGYLEDKHYKKIKKSDKPVVFTGRKAALWAIFFDRTSCSVSCLDFYTSC